MEPYKSLLHRIALALPLLVSFTPVRARQADSLLHQELSEVVVTGTNEAVDGRRLPYTVSIIKSAEIEAASSNRVLDILTGRVPSFFVTQRNILGYGVSNGGAGHIKLRGVGGDRASGVLMMVDGQPQFAGIYSHHIGDFYTRQNVERVEVLRGPGSVLYGSNAMAGVVNVVTKGVHKEGFAGSLNAEYGSRNTLTSSLSGTWRRGKAWAMASATYDHTDGTVRRFDFSQVSGYAKAGYDFSDNWKSYVDYTIVRFDDRDPIYPSLSRPGSNDIYCQDVLRGEASAVFSNSFASTNGTARIYYSYGNHYIDDPRHFHSTDDRLGVLLYQNFAPWRSASATVGFDFARYTGRIPVSGGNAHKPGSLATIDRKAIVEYSPYLTLSQQLLSGRMCVSAGVRGALSDKFGARAIPQGGVAVNLNGGLSFKASVAMGYRNPSFRELYLYKFANPDLKPERMMNYELSANRRFANGINITLTAYYIRGYDMIEQTPVRNENTGRFINKGLEATFDYAITPTLRGWASYSWLHTSLHNLTGAPRHQYFIGAQWQPVRKIYIDASLTGAAHLFVDSTMPYQSFATLNLKARWEVTQLLQITLRADNVTDARYTINRGYPMPGIGIFGGISLNI